MKRFFCIFLGMLSLYGLSADLPDWLEGWKLNGDLRVRYEGLDFDQAGRENRSRGRFRFRIGAGKKLTDKLAVKFRFATGGADPTSTNQSFDNSFNGKDFVIDRVFLTYQIQSWEVGAGKVANPFESTSMVWDTDVNPEGMYGRYRKGPFYATLGLMPVEEESTGPDTNLIAGQLGVETGDRISWSGSAAYYLYEGLEVFGQDYAFIDLLAGVTIKTALAPLSLQVDLVKNTTSTIDADDTALGIFARFGNAGKPGQWAVSLKYADIEAFSTLGAFADSDFGFSDKKGFSANAAYRASKHISWHVTIISIDGILDEDSGFDRIQIDCSLRF